jgi:vacuolar-type H+-ATPase subunit H
MGKIVKGIVLGAAVGAGIRVATDLRSEDDLGAIAPRVAKTAGEAARAGATVGVLLTVRDRRRMRKLAKQAKGMAKLRSMAETGLQVAVPALQQAGSITRERAVQAAEAAKPRVEHAVDVARPHVEKAAKDARKRYEKEMKKARPKVEKAAKDARERASNVADLAAEKAKRRLADLDLPTAVIAV